jgi:chemotaxis-related protein WspB
MLVLTFHIGSDCLALDVRRVREVVPRVHLQPVACSHSWLAGVFVYRGQVVPVIDLHRLVGAGECPPHLSTRIILVARTFGGAERLVGLLAAKVDEVRQLAPPAEALPRMTTPGQPDLGPVVVDGRQLVHLVELDRLLPESYESQLALAAQVGKELPA